MVILGDRMMDDCPPFFPVLLYFTVFIIMIVLEYYLAYGKHLVKVFVSVDFLF